MLYGWSSSMMIFLYAYEHGIVILCPDNRSWRFYPRIFTYSSDNPEKWAYKFFWSWQLLWWSPRNRALLATICNFGSCPCPLCLVPKSKIPEVGTAFFSRMTAWEISTCGRLELKLECFTCEGLHLWKRLQSQISSCGTFAGGGILYTNKGKTSYF